MEQQWLFGQLGMMDKHERRLELEQQRIFERLVREQLERGQLGQQQRILWLGQFQRLSWRLGLRWFSFQLHDGRLVLY
jgi:hypothetical protein